MLRDLTLENPIRAIREISHDITCRRRVRLANGREMRALDIQAEYLERALRSATARALARGGPGPRHVGALPEGPRVRPDLAGARVRLGGQAPADRADARAPRRALCAPQGGAARPQYHDVNRSRGLYYRCSSATGWTGPGPTTAITEAMTQPPETTRARLRGDFVKRAKERRRDFTVDWVHLKLNDQAQRTVLLKDPFQSHDERVEKLIQSL